MNALVLGNINSKWVKEYIEYVLLPIGYEVDVVGNEAQCKYSDFYKAEGVTVHKEFGPVGLAKKIPFARVMNSAKRIVEKNSWKNYDVIVNIFVNHRDLRITQKLKGENTKTVLYYAGSDLLRKSKTDLLLNRILLRNPTKHVVGSAMLANAFQEKYPKTDSAEIIRFGISAFENIKDQKKKYKRNSEKIVFCVGYSGIKEHNHIQVLDLFGNLDKKQKEKIRIFVPMTYGATTEYLTTVKNKLESLGIEYSCFTEFMNNDEMAKMWCGVDYFINAQTTDSLSASVLEALYAGAVLLNASWLEYPEYKEFGIKSLVFSEYDGLLKYLIEIVDGKKVGEDYNSVRILEENMSWNAAKERWEELLANGF
ncbi:MAG: hypothetical protein IJD95_02270 [Clostridia bacterium]|nr:hypothetical protein [Clostridia bacterium]